MKIKFPIAWILAFAAPTFPEVLYAGGVDENHIPESVDWLVHIDADRLRETRSGASLMAELVEISKENMDPDMPVNPVLLVNGVRSLTAFGTLPDFANGSQDVDGVLVIEGTGELIQVIRGLVSGMELENPEAVERVELGDTSILKMTGQEFSGTFLGENGIAIGKSQAALEDFLAVQSGKAPHLSLQERFSTNKLGKDSGIYAGAFVEGVNGFQNLPAQARILQLTRQVSLQFGESADLLQLFISLGTDSPQTARQVSDVLQGMIALMMITQSGNPDLATLVQSARTEREDSIVRLQLAYPAESAEAWISMISEVVKSHQEEAAEEELEAVGGDASSEIPEAEAAESPEEPAG